MVAVFPTPIEPSYFPDRPWSCEPGTFEFTNNSGNMNEIQSVLIEYGDGNEEIILGTDSMIHTYINPGKYDITATVTSVYGCIYVDSMPDIVEVIQIPTAEFTMSANPTTIFETTVKMQDNSSPTVVNWQWSSPGSVPSQSTQQNPVFNFPEGVISNYEIELIVETPEGCIDTVYHTLFVNSDILFFAPNAFTPDGDEFNQTWKFSVDGIDIYNFELLIFNRWGQIVWETHDTKSEWDGTYNGEIVPAGSFTWIARVKDIYTDKKKEFKGNINILR
jgi:gliding motility-associated-like protein